MVGATMLAQLITIGFSPILTRLYSPESFGVFSLFISFIGIVGPVLAFNLELTLQRQKSEEDVYVIFELGCIVSALMTLLFTALFALMQAYGFLGFAVFNTRDFCLVFVALVAVALFGLSRYVLIRRAHFSVINRVTLIKSLVRSAVQGVGGIVHDGAFFLLAGEAFGRSSGNLRMLREFYGSLSFRRGFNAYWGMMKRHSNYPLFVAPSSLLNSVAIMLPVVLVNKYHGVELAGMYGLVMRSVDVPVNVIGASVADVFYEKASRIHGQVRVFLIRHVLVLLAVGAVGGIFAYWWSGDVFSLVFGSQWRTAGELLVMVLPHFLLQFAVFPVSRTLHLIGKERYKLVYDSLALVAAIVPFVYGSSAGWTLETTLLTFSGCRAFAYFVMLLMLIRFTGHYDSHFVSVAD